MGRKLEVKLNKCIATMSIPRVPSGEATNPLNKQLPSLSLLAYPAIGVRQDPSNVVRKALSQEIASLVSSWFNEARYSACRNQPTIYDKTKLGNYIKDKILHSLKMKYFTCNSCSSI
jgi:acid stress-induced BolA-like protein IbaG/YrbA